MRRVLPALLIVGLLLAGCGGGGDDTTSATSATTNSAGGAPTAAGGPTAASGPTGIAGVAPGPMEGTVVGVSRDVPELTTLYATMLKAGVVDQLSTPGPFTLFAPTNGALAAKGVPGLLELLRSPRLKDVILGHVVSGLIAPSDLEAGDTLKTLAGTSLDVARSGDTLSVGGAKLVSKSPYASQNGLVYRLGGLAAEP